MSQIMNQGDDPHLRDNRLEFCNAMETPKYSRTNISKVKIIRNKGEKGGFFSLLFFLST